MRITSSLAASPVIARVPPDWPAVTDGSRRSSRALSSSRVLRGAGVRAGLRDRTQIEKGYALEVIPRLDERQGCKQFGELGRTVCFGRKAGVQAAQSGAQQRKPHPSVISRVGRTDGDGNNRAQSSYLRVGFFIVTHDRAFSLDSALPVF